MDDRIVVITGASAGVGRAAARAFARSGASLGLLARGEEGLAAAASDAESLGSRAVWKVADVSDADQVEEAAEAIERDLGPIDVWINNAMVTVMAEIRDMEAAEFRRVTEVTYLGAVHGTLAALKRDGAIGKRRTHLNYLSPIGAKRSRGLRCGLYQRSSRDRPLQKRSENRVKTP